MYIILMLFNLYYYYIFHSFLTHYNSNMSPNQRLLLHSLIPIVPRPELWAGSLDPALLYDYFGGADLMEFTK